MKNEIKLEQEAGRLATQFSGNRNLSANDGTQIKTLADYGLDKKDSYHAQQLFNEGIELKAIESEKARLRQVSTLKQGDEIPVKANFPERGQARDVIASTIGLGSGKQWDKLEVDK